MKCASCGADGVKCSACGVAIRPPRIDAKLTIIAEIKRNNDLCDYWVENPPRGVKDIATKIMKLRADNANMARYLSILERNRNIRDLKRIQRKMKQGQSAPVVADATPISNDVIEFFEKETKKDGTSG